MGEIARSTRMLEAASRDALAPSRLETLASRALLTSMAANSDSLPDSEYDKAQDAAFDARREFLAALERETGLGPVLIERLVYEGILL